MPPLTRIAAERERMSAIERRIADFLCDNAHLLRDYSSQQVAHALGISQSSVVKFAQKFGYRGYPDLKFSIGVAVARHGEELPDSPDSAPVSAPEDAAELALRELSSLRQAAQLQTQLTNPLPLLQQAVALIDQAPRVYVHGLGDDGVYARDLAMRLSLQGILAIHHADAILMLADLSTVRADDVLIVLSEYGKMQPLVHISRQFQALGGKVITITRHTANPLRASADTALAACANADAPYMAQLLYRSSLQLLLDSVFVLLCHANPERQRQLGVNLERVAQLIDA
ncbi:transcriptional regulator [Stenotrophomonas ginsengisoli]|uniref:Transcriptional regulator n=1 Tax=Stenotrophomonas ginsengisoli TaxID=336566 RepID=A0A0R0DLE9_9GAMM|nr:MurR/RpiR family transcriptional regulator [Stenotrophomonas ginsengisoli]KRG78456.1 transcriptional regulator [Stenotrophomonas ginsengisoli]